MRITSPLYKPSMVYVSIKEVLSSVHLSRKKKKKKKKKKFNAFCHLGILLQILIFCFSHKHYPRHYGGGFAHAISYDYWKTSEQGIGGLLLNDL